MPMDPDDEEKNDEWSPAASLSRDGKIEGLYLPRDQRREESTWTKEPPIDLPLELAERKPVEPEQLPEEAPRKPSRRGPIAIGAAVLLVCAAAIFFMVRKPSQVAAPAQAVVDDTPPAEKLGTPSEASGAPAVSVLSDPPGATVFIESEETGSTPLVSVNEFGKNTRVKIRLELKGYATWTGTFSGGVNATIRATLRRK
ncbi:MAG TPA: PEGA domain-containing protein [Myxococcales bacterium]|nr:PEGA domain-containing protein [Myxococcales bacterium]